MVPNIINFKMIAKRVKEIPFSGIRKFFELVQKSEGIVSLGGWRAELSNARGAEE